MIAWPDYGIGAVFTLIGLFFVVAPKTRDALLPGRLKGAAERTIFSWALFLFSLFWTIGVALAALPPR
jgi:hypothetical protein